MGSNVPSVPSVATIQKKRESTTPIVNRIVVITIAMRPLEENFHHVTSVDTAKEKGKVTCKSDDMKESLL